VVGPVTAPILSHPCGGVLKNFLILGKKSQDPFSRIAAGHPVSVPVMQWVSLAQGLT
jgi:hypothetical protein